VRINGGIYMNPVSLTNGTNLLFDWNRDLVNLAELSNRNHRSLSIIHLVLPTSCGRVALIVAVNTNVIGNRKIVLCLDNLTKLYPVMGIVPDFGNQFLVRHTLPCSVIGAGVNSRPN